MSVRQHLHYAGEILKCSFFLRLGLPSTLIGQDNGASRKRSSNRKTPALRFSVDGKYVYLFIYLFIYYNQWIKNQRMNCKRVPDPI